MQFNHCSNLGFFRYCKDIYSRDEFIVQITFQNKKKGEKLEFEFVGDFRRDVFEGTRSPGDPLEAHSVQAQPRQFTHLHFPLNYILVSSITVDTEKEKLFTLLIVAIISFQHLNDFFNHFEGIHWACCLHGPGKP